MRTTTFYSYKGGTGRTLLAANMALLAANLGQKVVILDFDLEAPGLAYKFFGTAQPSPGLVGWLGDALTAGEAPADLSGYLLEVEPTNPIVPGGRLHLMPAGRAPSPNYFQDLKRLRLEDRIDDGTAVAALVELQAQLERDMEADLLFVDARTGITTTNAVTTHVLADRVVALVLDMPEQLEGTRSVLRSLQPLTSLRTDEPIDLHVVLSRIPPRSDARNIWEPSDAERQQLVRVQEVLEEPAVPLTATIALSTIHALHADPTLGEKEQLFLARPGTWSRTTLNVDYQRVARAVLDPEVLEPATAILVEGSDDPEQGIDLAAYFADRDALRMRELAQPRLISIEDVEVALPGHIAVIVDQTMAAIEAGDHDRACERAATAFDQAQAVSGVEPVALAWLGVLVTERHLEAERAEEARTFAEEAAALLVDVDEEPAPLLRHRLLHQAAVAASRADAPDGEVITLLQQAVEAGRSLTARAVTTLAVQVTDLGMFANLLTRQGDTDEATKLEREAYELIRSGRDHPDLNDQVRQTFGLNATNYALHAYGDGAVEDAASAARDAMALIDSMAETDDDDLFVAATAAQVLALSIAASEGFTAAAPAFEDALDRDRRSGRHRTASTTGDLYLQMGAALYDTDERAALRHIQRSTEILSDAVEDGEPGAAANLERALDTLATVLRASGRPAEADKAEFRLEEVRRALLDR